MHHRLGPRVGGAGKGKRAHYDGEQSGGPPGELARERSICHGSAVRVRTHPELRLGLVLVGDHRPEAAA